MIRGFFYSSNFRAFPFPGSQFANKIIYQGQQNGHGFRYWFQYPCLCLCMDFGTMRAVLHWKRYGEGSVVSNVNWRKSSYRCLLLSSNWSVFLKVRCGRRIKLKKISCNFFRYQQYFLLPCHGSWGTRLPTGSLTRIFLTGKSYTGADQTRHDWIIPIPYWHCLVPSSRGTAFRAVAIQSFLLDCRAADAARNDVSYLTNKS